MGDPGDLGVLLRHAFRGVYDYDNHIRPLHGSNRTDNGIPFQFFLDLVLSPKTRRVNKDIFRISPDYVGIHRISGGSRYIGHNHPVLSGQLINNGRLAHIGLAHNSDPGAVILLFLQTLCAEMTGNHIQHIADSKTGSRGNGKRLADSKVVKLINVVAVLL